VFRLELNKLEGIDTTTMRQQLPTYSGGSSGSPAPAKSSQLRIALANPGSSQQATVQLLVRMRLATQWYNPITQAPSN